MKNNETEIDKNAILIPTHTETSKLVVDTKYSLYLDKYAGCYRIGPPTGYTSFSLDKKPNWFHRMFMKLLLGWEWVDNV
jgi:hypothetical protein